MENRTVKNFRGKDKKVIIGKKNILVQPIKKHITIAEYLFDEYDRKQYF